MSLSNKETSKNPSHKNGDEFSFAGQLLIAMPEMMDERFQKSIVYIFEHSEEGAMGLIINKKLGEITLGDLFDQMDIKMPEIDHPMDVHFGGPLETERGFVLHSTDVRFDTSLSFSQEIAVTSTLDILKSIAIEEGPKDALFILGYAGWTAGQLEEEIKQNVWLTMPAKSEFIFDEDKNDRQWEKAFLTLGLDPKKLSSYFGTA